MMKIIGYQVKKYSFTDDKTGALIEGEGVNLYVTSTRDNVVGEFCERIFVGQSKLGSYVPKVGDRIDIFYNRFGKVDLVQKVQ